MANRFTFPRETALDVNGSPLAGAKLFFYESGTTNPADSFADDALTIANANPVTADSAGRFGEIFLQALDYKVILTDVAGVTIWTADPVSGTIDATGDKFIPSPQSPADMTVLVGPGTIWDAAAKTRRVLAPQTTALIIAPTTNPRHDIVYIDRTSGAAGVQPGVEAASPADPTIPDGTLPVARVRLATATVVITAELIDDIRELAIVGAADPAARAIGTGGNEVPGGDTPGPWAGHLYGLELANNGANPATRIDIAAGFARDDADTAFLSYAGGTVDAGTAFGTGIGGLSATLTFSADNTYHFFLCRDAAGTVRVGIDTSTTAATLVAQHGIANPRRIGSRRTLAGAATWQTFYQQGDEVLVDWVQDTANNNPGTEAVLATTSLPLGLRVGWLGSVTLRMGVSTDFVHMLVMSPDQANIAPSNILHSCFTAPHVDTADDDIANFDGVVRTNTSAQIRFRVDLSNLNVTVRVMTRGWIDRRGKDGE